MGASQSNRSVSQIHLLWASQIQYMYLWHRSHVGIKFVHQRYTIGNTHFLNLFDVQTINVLRKKRV